MLNVATSGALARLNENLTSEKAGGPEEVEKTEFRLPPG